MLGIILMAGLAGMGAGNGKAMIPNSCNMSAQAPLETGMHALHNFEYEEAEQAFETAQKADPGCAMAWWGAAMTQWHELWDPSDEGELAAGWKDVEEAQSRAGKATPEERAYIDAVKAYFEPGPGGKAGKEKRTADGRAQAYREKMRELHKAYPGDTQGTLFFALAILAANDQGTRAEEIAQAKEAGALIETVFQAEPENPGAAHYLIHAYDRPELAEGALAAARAYAKIAPNAPHALHMPSHIFERLGLWQEDVASNEASIAAAKAAVPQTHEKIHEQLHALDFLQYGQTQLGDFPAAEQTTETAVALAIAHEDRFSAYIRYTLPVRMVVEENKWADWKKLPLPAGKDDGYWKALYLWLEVMAEARGCTDGTRMASGGHAAECTEKQAKAGTKATTAALKKLKAQAADAKKGDAADAYGDVGALETLVTEAEGWEAFARRDKAAAIEKLKAAVEDEAKPGSYGGFRKPASEMLGDLYLLLGEKSEAAAAYEQSLKEHPGRRLSEMGLKAAQG
jgi:tetratricopeptide (TPR) repeat protein